MGEEKDKPDFERNDEGLNEFIKRKSKENVIHGQCRPRKRNTKKR